MYQLVIDYDRLSAEQKTNILSPYKSCVAYGWDMVKKKPKILPTANLPATKSIPISLAGLGEKKKKFHVNLLYYDNLKIVSDIVLTQELQTFALLAC